MRAAGFAVIELATTGMFPHGRDRLVEVTVVHLDAHGRREGAWTAALGAARGASAGSFAPLPLRDAAPQLVALLAGRVLVAHNAAFGIRFLMAELERVTPWIAPEPVVLCTMQLCRALVPGTGRSLAAACAALAVQPDRSSSVAGRAEATARLLAACRERADCERWWREHLDDALACEWPHLGTGLPWAVRSHETERAGLGAAGAFASHRAFDVDLPPREAPAHVVDYLALLDRCVADRRAGTVDPDALAACATQLGLRADEWPELHCAWFDDLARSAFAADRSTIAAREELLDVARMLTLPTSVVSRVLSDASSSAA